MTKILKLLAVITAIIAAFAIVIRVIELISLVVGLCFDLIIRFSFFIEKNLIHLSNTVSQFSGTGIFTMIVLGIFVLFIIGMILDYLKDEFLN